MKKLTLALAVSSLLLLTACNDDDTKDADKKTESVQKEKNKEVAKAVHEKVKLGDTFELDFKPLFGNGVLGTVDYSVKGYEFVNIPAISEEKDLLLLDITFKNVGDKVINGMHYNYGFKFFDANGLEVSSDYYVELTDEQEVEYGILKNVALKQGATNKGKKIFSFDKALNAPEKISEIMIEEYGENPSDFTIKLSKK